MHKKDDIVIVPFNDLYRTADFGAICTLCYFGFTIDSLEHDPQFPSRVNVFFKREDGLDDLLQSLWSRQLNIEPLTFLETTRAVKARLRDRI